MQGLAPSSPFSRTDHRRNSSMESPPSAPLSSSPGVAPVRMLNGRVYGSRRAIEAADRERALREQNEPAFVEWGYGKQGAGLGSNTPKPEKGGFLGDAEEGSGMEWVKRRREERQRRDAEQKLRDTEGFRLRSDRGSRDGVSDVDTDERPGSEGHPTPSKLATPIIQVSEFSPSARSADPPSPNAQARPIPISQEQPCRGGDEMAKSAPVKLEDQDREHVTQAIQVPMHANRHDHHVHSGRGVDVFGDGLEGHLGSKGGNRSDDSMSSDDARRRREKQRDDQAVADEDESDSEEEEEERGEESEDDFADDDDDEDDTNAR